MLKAFMPCTSIYLILNFLKIIEFYIDFLSSYILNSFPCLVKSSSTEDLGVWHICKLSEV